MSGLHAKPQERPNPVVARLDDLFTLKGIHFNADNPHLLLHIADAHSDVAPATALPGNALNIRPPLRLEGAEHTAIGDNTLLRFSENAEPIRAQKSPCTCPTALR